MWLGPRQGDVRFVECEWRCIEVSQFLDGRPVNLGKSRANVVSGSWRMVGWMLAQGETDDGRMG